MILFRKLIVLFSIFWQCHSQSDDQFLYSGTLVPALWDCTYPKCLGDKQSPIDIPTNEVTADEDLIAITFGGYDTTPTAMSVTNSRNGVLATVEGVTTDIRIDLTSNRYNFHEADFHWGSANGQGSEHTINGKQYDAEIQLEHINDKYSSYRRAIVEDDGVVVLAVLVEIGDANSNIDEIIKALPDIKEPGDVKAVTTPFPLMNFLPESTAYYRYQGSETRPDCNENIVWTVFANPITMSQAQIDAFRLLDATNSTSTRIPLVDNFRPVQRFNDREVTGFGVNDCSRLSATRITFTLSLVVPLWLHLQN